MKLLRLILLFIIIMPGIQSKSQDYKDLGKVALSTNPLMPIMKGIPAVLDIRTGPVIHDFRYCTFWKHNSSTFYDVFDPLDEKVSFQVSKAMEVGYALKIPLNIVDGSSFLVYTAPQFLYSTYKFGGLPVKYLVRNTNNQVDQEVSGKLVINRYMGMLGIMIFPDGGLFMDVYVSLGMRKFSADFNESIPGTNIEINSKSVNFVKPEKIGEAFFDGSGRLSVQSGFRFGISF